MQTAYTTYFGFSEKPFKFKPEPRFFYHNPNYDSTYCGVVKGLRERKSWIVLTGESGTGKTTLLHKCRIELGANFRIIPVPNTLPNSNSFLSYIGKNLNLDISDDISGDVSKANHSRIIAQIRTFLANQTQQGQATAILIEDAQNLVDSVLTGMLDLNNASGAQESRLQIIMLGSPELDEKLRRLNLPSADTVYCRLNPLRRSEIDAFIQHQIQAANYQGNDLFSPDVIEHIVCYSKGIPRLINTLCDSALIIASRQNQKMITKMIIEEAAHRCYLVVDSNTDDSNKTPSTVSKRPSQNHQPIPKKISSYSSQLPAIRPGFSMNRRWLWTSVTVTVTLILFGSALLLYQNSGVTPSIAMLSSNTQMTAIPPANTTSAKKNSEAATTPSPVAIRPTPSQKTNVASADIFSAPQFRITDAPTVEAIPNTYIESTRTGVAESTISPRNSTPKNDDLPRETFTAFEKPSSTENFQPHSSSVFVEVRGPNNEVFDSAGRVKSLITLKDTDLQN